MRRTREMRVHEAGGDGLAKEGEEEEGRKQMNKAHEANDASS